MPDISIIMPVYNVEKYVSEAIDSVLRQRGYNIELIIVNDGSTDNSKLIVENYLSLNPNIILLNKENGGLSSARNYGLSYASAPYIMFLDSDDTLEELPNLSELTSDVTICAYNRIEATQDNTIISTTRMTLTEGSCYKPYTSYLFIKNWNFLNFAWNKIWRTSFLKQNNLYFENGLSLIEDLEFSSRAYAHQPTIKFIDSSIVNYFVRPIFTLSKSFRTDLPNLLERKQILFEQYCKIFQTNNKERKKILSENASDDIRYLISMLKYSKEQKNIGHTLKTMLECESFQKRIYLRYSRTLKEFLVNLAYILKLGRVLRWFYRCN